jgi:hypothetical protein
MQLVNIVTELHIAQNVAIKAVIVVERLKHSKSQEFILWYAEV